MFLTACVGLICAAPPRVCPPLVVVVCPPVVVVCPPVVLQPAPPPPVVVTKVEEKPAPPPPVAKPAPQIVRVPTHEVSAKLGVDLTTLFFGGAEPHDPYGPCDVPFKHPGFGFAFHAYPDIVHRPAVTPDYQELKRNFERALRTAFETPLFTAPPAAHRPWVWSKLMRPEWHSERSRWKSENDVTVVYYTIPRRERVYDLRMLLTPTQRLLRKFDPPAVGKPDPLFADPPAPKPEWLTWEAVRKEERWAGYHLGP